MSIISTIPAIENIWWSKARKGKSLKADKIVFVSQDGRDDLVIAKLQNGDFVCSHDLYGKEYMPGKWPWQDRVLKGLVAIGAISEADMTLHLANVEAISNARDARYRAKRLAEDLKDASLTPTPEQSAYIAKHSDPSHDR